MQIKIDCKCWNCSKIFQVECNHKDYDSWKVDGKLIQEVMPYLRADERELLISNTCNDCWQALFGNLDCDQYHFWELFMLYYFYLDTGIAMKADTEQEAKEKALVWLIEALRQRTVDLTAEEEQL